MVSRYLLFDLGNIMKSSKKLSTLILFLILQKITGMENGES
jgi:hypothetical protein